MAEQFTYSDAAAAAYDQTFGCHVSVLVGPTLVRVASLESGMRVLEVATGTGLVAEAALQAIGLSGHLTATDISLGMLDRARARLGDYPNVELAREDGQALSFPDASFDAVICSLGLMFFPDPARGLAEFRRVLRPGGCAAVAVNTEMAYDTAIVRALGRHSPRLTEASARMFSFHDEDHLRSVFQSAGFADISISAETIRVTRPSFAAFFGPWERGGGSIGQAFVALPEDERAAVREDVRRAVGDTGGPVVIEQKTWFARGLRK
jgi:ubiquinone/menaquinone biosynthesis C-methylase UbiE